MTALEPDRDQIEIFVNAIFRHAGADGFVSVRSFRDDVDKGFRISPAALSGGLRFLVDVAEDDARRAAQNPKPIVFAPPLAVFSSKARAREQDIIAGLALSVECDEHPQEARATLEQLLGPATVVVKSGGQWVNGGEQAADKLHLHWRLACPARGGDLPRLKQARDLAARIVGGDPSNKPVCHPIRWPGSWHRKSAPRLCQIETLVADREIDLDTALATLTAAAPVKAAPASDNAGPSEDWPRLVADIINGKSFHAPLVSLSARLIGSQMHDKTSVKLLRALMLASTAPHDEQRWQPRFDSIPRIVESARAKYQTKPDAAAPEIYLVDTLRIETFPTLKQIAGDIIVEGLTLLAARPKVGKTWLALDVAVAVDQATYCLGDFKCEQGDVLFLALEDNRRRMQRRLTKLLGVNKAVWPRFACAHTWPRAHEGGVDRIREWIKKAANPRLVVIDVLARFRKPVQPGKQSYDSDYEAIAELQKIASDTGVAILVIHHTRKGEADDPIDAVSGTLGLAGAADAVLVIARNGQAVRLYGRSRDVDEIDKAMTFDKATCRWTILGETADVQRSKERQEIISTISTGPMALKDVAMTLGKPVKTVFKLLEKMVAGGEVTRPSRGVYAPATPGGNGGKVEMEQWWQR
jgi:hypothetical protein